MTSLGDTINYKIVPPIFLLFFTASAQFLAHVGNPEVPFQPSFLLGNLFAWKIISSFVIWAILWLWVPSKQFPGPMTSFGLTPMYQANGELYYGASMTVFSLIVTIKPTICVSIYQNMGPILGALNILALSLCLFLLIRAKLDKNVKDPYLRTAKYPIFHEFYRGMDLHPRLLGVDVKQLTNCRVGMMSWQLLILTYFFAACQLHGFNWGHLVNVSLQTIYIFKFFHWETGYFNTLDITLDRAGYYLCWGCLVWIPSLYTFHSYFFVYHQPNNSFLSAAIIFALGLASIYLNYEVDRQKQIFRTANGSRGGVKIWGQPVQALKVTYTTVTGEGKTSELMISGFWGLARKINYTFELSAALMWSIPGGLHFGLWPLLYFIFLFILLIHRVIRDEKKLKDKYGKGWTEYCKKVPYRMIPYVF